MGRTLRVGVAIDKTVLVHGDRVYRRTGIGVGPSAPVPFTTRPIRYEWAFGGSDTSDPDRSVHRIDTRNPVGRGVAIRAKNLIDQPAHAIEYPRGEPAQSGPAGFGPIDRAWSPRRELAGTFDARWMSSKRPLLPDDYDPAYALCAPADQRIGGFLHGGETIELVNMTPDGLLRFAMPSRYLSFRSRFGSRYRAHSGQLATVHIDAQEFRLHLIWQSALEVAARDADYLDETQVVELARP
jgi:hypothetical protein